MILEQNINLNGWKNIVLDYWKYYYLKWLTVNIQIHVIRFGSHIFN